MTKKATLLTVIVLTSFLSTFGQAKKAENSYKQVDFELSMDSCFAKTLTYLQDYNYFVEVVDRSSGFIRAKSYTKNNKVFTSQAGEKKTISFLYSLVGNKTRLSLNIYSESFNQGGNTGSLVYYYEDKGVIDDTTPYQQLITDLRKTIH